MLKNVSLCVWGGGGPGSFNYHNADLAPRLFSHPYPISMYGTRKQSDKNFKV